MKRLNSLIYLVFVASLFLQAEQDIRAEEVFDKGLAEISIKAKNEVIPYREFALFLLPLEKITLVVERNPTAAQYVLWEGNDIVNPRPKNQWHWQAPSRPGIYPLRITDESGDRQMIINIWVMVPINQLKGEYLNGYRIGHYPEVAFRNLEVYRKPQGFIEVTADNANLKISPHFTMGQFLSKQPSSFPKYLVLKERLLLKLEMILRKINENQYTVSSLVIMSGYRTPFYNKLIRNVQYSRHLWGDAADIFIDENPQDGVMDDLNMDDKTDYRDAAVLFEIIDGLSGKPFYERFTGGLARYKSTKYHGPFVHVDARGFMVRWGF